MDCPAGMIVSGQDNRKWNASVYEFRLQFAADLYNALRSFSGGTSYAMELEMALDGSEIVVVDSEFVGEAGAEWIPAPPFAWAAPGSALDLSATMPPDAPAGRHGRVVRRGAHFEFEGLPGVPQRFYGVNLCYGANSPASNEVAFARHLARTGYYEIARVSCPVPVFADPAADGVEPVAVRDGALRLAIRNATAGTKFARVGVSDERIPAGTAL